MYDLHDPKAPAMITTAEAVARIFVLHKASHGTVPLVATSGAFDPLHIGHTRCIRAAGMLKGDHGLHVVIVNGDGFLQRKKGYVFMPLQERMEIISNFKGVDYVVPWDDGTQFVSEALSIIRPNIFAKGGPRSERKDIPEYNTCMLIKCAVVMGIGGNEKLRSSSDLVEKIDTARKTQ